MKYLAYIISCLCLTLVISCGESQEKEEKEQIKIGTSKSQNKKATTSETVAVKASETIDLTNKGVGPITEVTLNSDIDQTMVSAGAEVFKAKCTACHKIGKKFIGPAPNGILRRRTPEWIMNMILDPEGMVANDPLAKQLLIEHNGSPMANQSLTQEEARSILEYFRTL